MDLKEGLIETDKSGLVISAQSYKLLNRGSDIL